MAAPKRSVRQLRMRWPSVLPLTHASRPAGPCGELLSGFDAAPARRRNPPYHNAPRKAARKSNRSGYDKGPEEPPRLIDDHAGDDRRLATAAAVSPIAQPAIRPAPT